MMQRIRTRLLPITALWALSILAPALPWSDGCATARAQEAQSITSQTARVGETTPQGVTLVSASRVQAESATDASDVIAAALPDAVAPIATAAPESRTSRADAVSRSEIIRSSGSTTAAPTPTPTLAPTLADATAYTYKGDALVAHPDPTATPQPTAAPKSSTSSSSGQKSYKGYSVGDTISVTVTHYCPCAKCNGAKNVGIAANGQKLKVGMAALNWLPLGSVVEVGGKRYTITDRGVGSNRIDIFVKSHSYAYELGKFKSKLTIIKIGK